MLSAIDRQINENYSNTAIVYKDQIVTYNKLETQVNNLTMKLSKFKNQPIGFCLNRGPKNVIAMLAILKSGNFYVPLDKSYPFERIKFIVTDTGLKNVITDIDDEDLMKFFKENCEVYEPITDSITESITEIKSTDVLPPVHIKQYSEKEDCKLAYIVYTSGTTGTPKGVMINRNSLLNLIESAIKTLGLKKTSILNYTSIGFDAAGWDIYIGLLTGGTIYMADDRLVVSPIECYEYIKENKIDMITVTPAYIDQFPLEHISTLSTIVVMGDKPDLKKMEFWSEKSKVYNGYGPTETTIGATIHKYKSGDSALNIGKPFDNYEIYLLDDDQNEVFTGIGEMYIGGVGVGVGYWNQIELTNRKFVMTKYGRLYKTGDLAKRIGDEYEFVGRKDNQIKINGVRIELEEIENLISKSGYVRNSCVIYDKHLVVYFTKTPEQSTQSVVNNLKSYLGKYLHRAVLPKRYQLIDKFMLTSNGKIDKKNLPKYEEKVEVVPATNEVEQIIIDSYKSTLNVEHVGIDSNFFELGGDSLRISQIVHFLRINCLDVDPVDVLKYPTIKDLAVVVKKISDNEILEDSFEIKHKHDAKSGQLELTPYQMNLWQYQTIYPDDTSYNSPTVYMIKGKDVKTIGKKVQNMFDRHPALRTKIVMLEGKLYQIFDEVSTDKITDDENIEVCEITEIKSKIEEFVEKKFDMTSDILCRVKIISIVESPDKQSNNSYCLIFVKHNMIIDAYSEKILDNEIKDIGIIYEKGNSKKMEQFGEFVKSKFGDSNNREYWIKKLDGYGPTKIITKPGHKIRNIVKQIKIKDISKFSREFGVTYFNVLITGLNVLLFRYTQSTDIVVGTQIANRSDPRWNDLVGFMVSTLVLRNKFNHNNTINELVQQVSSTIREAIEYQYVTYDELVKMCGLVDVMFVMQSVQNLDDVLKTETIERINKFNLDRNTNAFPLYFDVYPDSVSESFTVHVRTSKDFSIDLEKLLDSYELILNEMIEKCYSPVSLIKYINYDPIIYGPENDWSITTIDQAFLSRVKKHGSKTCMLFSTDDHDHLDSQLSYNELNKKSNQFANCLMTKYGLKPGSIVGLKMRRSKNFVIAMLSVLKTGSCYVPIDADYPRDRTEYMIENCKPSVVICNEKKEDSDQKTKFVQFDDLESESKTFSDLDVTNMSTPDSLAYIIYTSGSTGKPKGCMVTHKAVMNVMNHYKNELKINKKDKIWSLTSISFDIMVLEIFLPLTAGAELMLCPQCVSSNPVTLVNWINKHKPTVLQATPTQFSIIIDHLNENQNMSILVGGEAVTTKLAKSLLKVTNKVYNVYGPSETTIWSTSKKIELSGEVTIGTSMSNTQCVILDNNKQPVPYGCVGELCIGGDGVAVGYLGRDDLTKEKFIEFENKRFYRTGDLVILNYKNEIEYIGRTDFQVKIRGHRVELEEIIGVMEKHKSVKRATVIAKKVNDSMMLIGYYVGSKHDSSNKSTTDGLHESKTGGLHEYMRSLLPSYMVPSIIVWVPRFPETLNGKIDSNKLPDPFTDGTVEYVKSENYVSPRNKLEKDLRELFIEIIGCKDISVTESILNVGATSIMFPIFVNKIEGRFKVKLTIEEFIKNSTVELCAKLIAI